MLLQKLSHVESKIFHLWSTDTNREKFDSHRNPLRKKEVLSIVMPCHLLGTLLQSLLCSLHFSDRKLKNFWCSLLSPFGLQLNS